MLKKINIEKLDFQVERKYILCLKQVQLLIRS